MIYMAGNEIEEKKVGLRQIAKATGTPEPFAAKVLQQLVKSKLLDSYKGPSGGFKLVKNNIALFDIVEAIDGRDIMERCILGLVDCSNESPCPVHSRYVLIRKQLRDTLLSTNILDFDSEIKKLF